MNVIPLSAGNSGQKLKFYINRNKRLKKCLEQENEPPKKAVILQTFKAIKTTNKQEFTKTDRN